jgi:uncharacterized surface protein with fasciclin (FAS1) repeats
MEIDAMRRLFIKIAGLAMTAALVSACGGSDDPPAANLAQTAQAQGFTKLVAAATKAGLVPTLSDAATNVTVLGPTDAAFTTLASRLGFASADAMVTALDGPTLAKILQYHVLPGRKTAADLVAGGASQATLYSYGGSATTLAVKTTGGVKFGDAVLSDAMVTIADVQATLVGAVVSANLAGTLSGPGPFTVFAPTNDAFASIASTVAGLSVPQLTTVLTYHVLGSQVLSSGIPFGAPATTLANQNITINRGTAPVIATITDTTTTPANIVAVDVRASNGVIHVINKVLLPSLAN